MNPHFMHKGNVINGVINLSPKEVLEECQNGAVILDMRRDFEIRYKQFDVENVIYARIDFIHERYTEVPKDKPLIIADQAGVHSREITAFLMEKGFGNVANLTGGIFEWDKDGLPLKIDAGSMLSGQCLCVLRPPAKPKDA
jgi:rhodanese-related sulfurtransferase